jgi:3-deoxy-D-manno-octulosonic-acid transferase
LTYFVYNLCLWAASPLIALWAIYRVAKGRLPGISERLGIIGKGPGGRGPGTASGPVVWFHAVSLGEAKIAGHLAAELRQRKPSLQVVFTSSTATGFKEACHYAAPGDTVLRPPLDYRWICRRFLDRLQPDVVVIFETELWPNLFRETKRCGAGLLLLNGRISDRALPRYRATRWLWRRVLSYPDAILAQSSRDAERFSQIGAPAERLHVSGNAKYGMRPMISPLAEELRSATSAASAEVVPDAVIVAGSTMPGEEQYVLQSFLALRSEFPRLLLILAPRHPERCGKVETEIHRLGMPCQRRSQWKAGDALLPGIFLLDSTGELAGLYDLATAAFIGGTLVPTGGHNILEPAWFSCPTVIGPSMENFRETASRFLSAPGPGSVPGADAIAAGAILQVQDAAGLTSALRYILKNPSYARQLGRTAHDLLHSETSVLSNMIDEIEKRLISLEASLPNSAGASEAAVARLK